MQYNSKDVSVSQRQIYILSLLSENVQGYGYDEIMSRLKNWDIHVSKRTIQRDIDELSMNYGIYEEERNGKVYFYADKYTLKNVDFTIEDLASLAFAKEMLKGYRHLSLGKHAISFIEKIVESSTCLNIREFEKLSLQFQQDIQNRDNLVEIDEKMDKKIQNAMDKLNKISIHYYSYTSDEVTKRIIHPYRFVIMDSNLCVEGYCELRKEIRCFRLSRIKELKVLDERFKKQDIAEKNHSFLKLMGGVSEEIELFFTGDSVRYVLEYERNRAKKLNQTKQGLYFYQNAPVADDVIRWIRGFGPDVTVLKPQWLANQLKQEAKQCIKKE